MNKEDDFLYDDNDSVAFIKNVLPETVKNKYDDDDIIYIIDLIYDFYESKGFMNDDLETEEDDDAQVDFDEEELVAYVQNNAIADGMGKYSTDDIALIVQAELEYCESIGMFE